MFFPANNSGDIAFFGSTLILPSISIGNVGQLAIDLIIFNDDMRKVGYLESDAVLPLIGPNPFHSSNMESSSAITLNLEIYQSMDGSLTVLQQRAPFVQHEAKSFYLKLEEWIKVAGFSQIVVLTGADASRRTDAQLQGSSSRIVFNGKVISSIKDAVKSMGLMELEPTPVPDFVVSDKKERLILHGSGHLARMIISLTDSAEEKSTIWLEKPLVVISWFCVEGENIGDAVGLAGTASQVLTHLNKPIESTVANLKLAESTKKWRVPDSWEHMFGDLKYSRDLYQ